MPCTFVVSFKEVLEGQDARFSRIWSGVTHAGPLLAGEGRVATLAWITTAVAAVVTDLQSSLVGTRL